MGRMSYKSISKICVIRTGGLLIITEDIKYKIGCFFDSIDGGECEKYVVTIYHDTALHYNLKDLTFLGISLIFID